MTSAVLEAIGHVYATAQIMLAALDVDWWVQIDPELGWPTVRLRVIDRRGESRRRWAWELDVLAVRADYDALARRRIERGIRELRQMIGDTPRAET